jgi:hypothetical protein
MRLTVAVLSLVTPPIVLIGMPPAPALARMDHCCSGCANDESRAGMKSYVTCQEACVTQSPPEQTPHRPSRSVRSHPFKSPPAGQGSGHWILGSTAF